LEILWHPDESRNKVPNPLQTKATATRVPGPVDPTLKTFHRTPASTKVDMGARAGLPVRAPKSARLRREAKQESIR